jgi:hypothetical protein
MRDAVASAETYLNDHGDPWSEKSARHLRLRAVQRSVARQARAAQHELDHLTERTGGTASYPSQIGAVDEAVLDIAGLIREQYSTT